MVTCTCFRAVHVFGLDGDVRSGTSIQKTLKSFKKSGESQIDLSPTGVRVPFARIRWRHYMANQAAAFVVFLEWIFCCTAFRRR